MSGWASVAAVTVSVWLVGGLTWGWRIGRRYVLAQADHTERSRWGTPVQEGYVGHHRAPPRSRG